MLEPDFDPAPTAVQIGRCGYPCPCRAPRCATSRATISGRSMQPAGQSVKSNCAITMPERWLLVNAGAASRYSTAAIGASQTFCASAARLSAGGRQRPLVVGWLRPFSGPKLLHSCRVSADFTHCDCLDAADDHFVACGIT